MNIEIPVTAFSASPLVAMVCLSAFLVKKYGAPDLRTTVSSVLAFFGAGLYAVCFSYFAMALFNGGPTPSFDISGVEGQSVTSAATQIAQSPPAHKLWLMVGGAGVGTLNFIAAMITKHAGAKQS